MDVVWEVSVEGVPEVLAHVEGRVEGAEGPAPGLPDKACEDVQDLVCGGGRQTHKGMCHPGGETVWQDQKPTAGERSPVPTEPLKWGFSKLGCIKET